MKFFKEAKTIIFVDVWLNSFRFYLENHKELIKDFFDFFKLMKFMKSVLNAITKVHCNKNSIKGFRTC